MGKVFKSNAGLLILDPEAERLRTKFDQPVRVKYQESSTGFKNLAHLQSIENKFKCLHMLDYPKLVCVKIH